MADRLAEMEVRAQIDTLAMLDANEVVDTLTKRLAEMDMNKEKNRKGNLTAVQKHRS